MATLDLAHLSDVDRYEVLLQAANRDLAQLRIELVMERHKRAELEKLLDTLAREEKEAAYAKTSKQLPDAARLVAAEC